MKFIKRFIFILVLLLIAFFLYRLISPQGAKQLLYDLKLSSNSNIGTDFPLSGDALVTSGTTLAITGNLLPATGSLFEITGDEELLLTDAELYQENIPTETITTGTLITGSFPVVTTTASVPVVPTTKVVPITKKPSTVSKGLSTQDKRDVNNLLQGFGN